MSTPHCDTCTCPERVTRWKPEYDQETKCSSCGHLYYRHFDTYDEMRPVGCKYCDCWLFAVPNKVRMNDEQPSRTDDG